MLNYNHIVGGFFSAVAVLISNVQIFIKLRMINASHYQICTSLTLFKNGSHAFAYYPDLILKLIRPHLRQNPKV